ncbi:hypothetical protein Q7C36_003102 [Tachysurus vachellii]|uniref:Uncharacterized protein n=1 Tax=Tachysurus vachellii TaxID=175792 RepID=A0AA88NS83_TACVA|nr:hypothetical protein Q7C36_003102 [Tachysurus vachellii]
MQEAQRSTLVVRRRQGSEHRHRLRLLATEPSASGSVRLLVLASTICSSSSSAFGTENDLCIISSSHIFKCSEMRDDMSKTCCLECVSSFAWKQKYICACCSLITPSLQRVTKKKVKENILASVLSGLLCSSERLEIPIYFLPKDTLLYSTF